MEKLTIITGLAFLFVLATALPADPNDDDYECLTSWHEYDSALSSFRDASSTTVTHSTWKYVSTITDSNVPLTTLCDGRARAMESYKYTTITETRNEDEPYYTDISYPPYTEPSPTCEIAETACTPIYASWTSAYDEWLSNSEELPSPSDPHCDPTPRQPTGDPACSRWPERCMIVAAGSKTLYYWPVTTVSGDFCKRNGSTVTPSPTITGVANTAVVDGHTFTSPTNYLSVKHAHAAIFSDYKRIYSCGIDRRFVEHTDVVVPITASLASRINRGSDPFVPFDFADLNQPIPAEVYDKYQCMGLDRPCSQLPISDEGNYKPALAVPTEVLDLEDEWRSVGCSFIDQWSTWRVTPVPLQTPPPRQF